jgi:hypothetical protein
MAYVPSDYAHLIAACLFHDIGYVRGILNGDEPNNYIIDANGGKARLPRGSSDAALLPYHVDRSKLYVLDRLGGSDLIDAGGLRTPSSLPVFPPPRPTINTTKKACWCAPPISSDNWAIRIICAR